MQDEALITGTVVGAPGVAVAGWVQLGKTPRRFVAHEVRITDAAGHEIEIAGLRSARVEPVTRRTAAWREHEADPLAQLCLDDAPAPDVEVELAVAVLRGGEAISVWGEVATGTAPKITRLVAQAIAAGPRHGARIEELRAEHAAAAERDREAAAAVSPRPSSPAAATSRMPAQDPDHTDRLARSWGTWIGAPALVGLAALAFTMPPSWRVPLLIAASVLAGLPLVLDALVLPRFRRGTADLPSLEVPGTAFVIAGALAVMCAWGLASEDVAPDRATGVRVAGLLFAFVAAAATVWCLVATRTRRRLVGILASAPPHEVPLKDGVWGRSDGVLAAGGRGTRSAGNASVLVAVGVSATAFGARTKDSNGVYSRAVSTTPLRQIVDEAALVTDHGKIPVQLSEASWISMVQLDQSTGSASVGDTGVRADVIAVDQPVRVVGRAKNGVLVKGGAASLLIFAAAVGTDVAKAVRRARRRERTTLALALASIACVVAATALAIAG